MLYRTYTIFSLIPLIGYPFKKLHKVIWNPSLIKFAEKIISKTEKKRVNEAHRMYLIRMADRNLAKKKARTVITVLGMSIGIAIIVFLLSIGYGIEKLVISQIASLDELRIVDVTSGTNSALRLDQGIVKKIQKLENVKQVVPVVSLVGRVSLNSSNTDVLVYAAPSSYFDLTNIPVSHGRKYDNNVVAMSTSRQVAGAQTALQSGVAGEPIKSGERITFNIIPEKDAAIWDDCATSAKVIGYLPRLEGGFTGQEVWGSEYYPYEAQGRSGRDEKRGVHLGEWVQASIPVYTKGSDDVMRPEFTSAGAQNWVKGCIQSRFVQVNERISTTAVLGESTSDVQELTSYDSSDVLAEESESSGSADLLLSGEFPATESGLLDFEEFNATPAADSKKEETLSFKGAITHEAVVSQGLIEVLGVNAEDAINTDFEVSFIVMNTILPDVEGRAFTEKTKYKIVGVIADLESPYFYVPLGDILTLGPISFTQLKVDITDEKHVEKIRLQIEELGFTTNTTLDTVQQIQSLFNNLRILLGLLGLVALGVASLGMFNTLTVSLLERTREIGGMKTMGMVSDEIEDLFLAEAMIMGVAGGVGGLTLGYMIGKFVSLAVSIVSISRGQGFLDLTHIPFFLIAFILISSFFVGIVTGVVPAYRAKKISALNALRYE
jgi:ABC-type antimicrobial peptide transport system permease subunit